MKARWFITALALFMAFNLSAQEEKTKKELRQEKKELKKKEFLAKQALGKALLENKDFVLEANLLTGKKGQTAQALPKINFIAINGSHIHMQLGSANTLGWNGVGGITFEGEANTYEVYDDSKSDRVGVRIRYSSMYSRDIITIDLSINGERATARVVSEGRILTMQGSYMSRSESNVFVSQNFVIRN